MTIRLPLGYENFKTIIDKRFDFVDKSLFIKEILDDDATQVLVITRPRRFGKTLNLSMLYHFLVAEVNGQSTQGLFTGLKIAALGDEYMRHQGQYPVIFMTFKNVQDGGFEHALGNIAILLAEVYKEHRYLLKSSKLEEEDRTFYQAILNEKADQLMLEIALKKLTGYLYQHYGVKPWLLIDEYDTPIQASYLKGYFKPMIACMRKVLGAALKTNPYLERAVLTGILRISKENLFSGLNNLEVYSVVQSEYGQYFGFTEEEVLNLLQQSELISHSGEIRNWYNGYKIGMWTVYNPWSIVKCIRRQGELVQYWINTSDNELIKDLLTHSNEGFRTQFEDLLRGETVEKVIDEKLVFEDLKKNETAAWTVLLMAGYLKVMASHRDEEELWCTLDIPNREVRSAYRQIIRQWLSNGHGTAWFNQFLNHLLTGNLPAFEADFRHLVEETFSVHDTSKDPEKSTGELILTCAARAEGPRVMEDPSQPFYHGFMVGATASLYHNKNYEIKSNREKSAGERILTHAVRGEAPRAMDGPSQSGYGRYDYLIFSHDLSKPTILMEIKRVKMTEKMSTDDLDKILAQTAQQALVQIQRKQWNEPIRPLRWPD